MDRHTVFLPTDRKALKQGVNVTATLEMKILLGIPISQVSKEKKAMIINVLFILLRSIPKMAAP